MNTPNVWVWLEIDQIEKAAVPGEATSLYLWAGNKSSIYFLQNCNKVFETNK